MLTRLLVAYFSQEILRLSDNASIFHSPKYPKPGQDIFGFGWTGKEEIAIITPAGLELLQVRLPSWFVVLVEPNLHCSN
jgi:hypothetical protein